MNHERLAQTVNDARLVDLAYRSEEREMKLIQGGGQPKPCCEEFERAEEVDEMIILTESGYGIVGSFAFANKDSQVVIDALIRFCPFCGSSLPKIKELSVN